MTEQELLDAVRNLMAKAPPNDGPVGITTGEIADDLQMNRDRALERMKQLQKEGKVKAVKVRRIRCDGDPNRVTGWQPI